MAKDIGILRSSAGGGIKMSGSGQLDSMHATHAMLDVKRSSI